MSFTPYTAGLGEAPLSKRTVFLKGTGLYNSLVSMFNHSAFTCLIITQEVAIALGPYPEQWAKEDQGVNADVCLTSHTPQLASSTYTQICLN